jgi:hypothetical protein
MAEEYDFPQRNHFRVHDLFVAGPGRVFLNEWARRDAIDPDCYNGKITTCRPWGEVDQAQIWRAKWHYRAAISVREYGLRDMRDIRDWLLESAREQLDWLRNTDEQGRPKKLMKCGSVEQLAREARKFELLRGQVRQRPPGVRLPADYFGGVFADGDCSVSVGAPLGIADEYFVMDAGAGYSVVRLLSPAALDLESDRMRHCIGRGAYDERVSRPHAFRYFSLRDPDGQPVATVEAKRAAGEGWLVVQCQGPRNTVPPPHIADLWAGVQTQLDIREPTDADHVYTRLPPMNLGPFGELSMTTTKRPLWRTDAKLADDIEEHIADLKDSLRFTESERGRQRIRKRMEELEAQLSEMCC